MVKELKNPKTDFEKWLIGLEKDFEEPVVISLLIKKGKASFISIVSQSSFEEDIEEDEGEELPAKEPQEDNKMFRIKYIS